MSRLDSGFIDFFDTMQAAILFNFFGDLCHKYSENLSVKGIKVGISGVERVIPNKMLYLYRQLVFRKGSILAIFKFGNSNTGMLVRGKCLSGDQY